MKNFQQNLFVVLAVGLCALCAWQWYVQTALHTAGERLQEKVYKQSVAIQDFTNTIKNMDAEIAGQSARIAELKQAAMTNAQAAVAQKREIVRLQMAGNTMSNEIVQYKNAVDELEAKLKAAYDGVKKQNDAIKQLVAERDDAIKKYNDSIKDRNALAEKYNALVDRFNKLQAAGTPDATKH
jgi:chromosome segregation ATPase